MKIEEIYNLVFYKMEKFHQITIDLVSDVEDVFDNEPTLEEIGALQYKISILLEVLNPDFKDDIDVLNNLTHELELIGKKYN